MVDPARVGERKLDLPQCVARSPHLRIPPGNRISCQGDGQGAGGYELSVARRPPVHGLTRSPYPQAGDGANAFRMSSAQAEPTLRSADALLSAGLIDPAARDAVAAVEQRYAIAVSPAMRALIQHAG